jgi:hypothetical protein
MIPKHDIRHRAYSSIMFMLQISFNMHNFTLACISSKLCKSGKIR